MFRDLVVVGQIGEGGFGVVYEAEHVVLDEKRAIKKLEPVFAERQYEEEALRRFSREVKILNRLSHPGIVKLYDAGIAGTYPFIVMEYVEGRNINEIISGDGLFEIEKAQKVMLLVLDAVASAHKAGVVHRDIKPTNIMWDGNRAVLLDYGASQWLEQQLSTRMTKTAIGTTGYIADELKENPTLLDPCLDCFSLGVVFHYLLTGRIPSTGDPTHYLEQNLVPKEIIELILRALSPMGKRFADGSDMLLALNDIVANTSVVSPVS
jgi:serine/threonine-protein kinase